MNSSAVIVPDGGSRRREDPSEWSPRVAVDRYLSRRHTDATEASIKAWKYRLKLFVEWLEGLGVHQVGELEPYDLDDYFHIRSREIAPATLEGQMWTLKMFIGYLESVGAVDDLQKAVRIPDLDDEDRRRETSLREESALVLLEAYRESSSLYASRAHAFLELAWFIGARLGGLRALDLRDVNYEENVVEFRHRPETGTPLKNKLEGERPVGLNSETIEIIGDYVRENRYDVRDPHGRQPLLASARGRPGEDTVRAWSYLATQPCVAGSCPHGQVPESCEMTEWAHASKCPSSRSPHHIRTGSITWQLNKGLPPAVVAERVNSDVKTIKKHYDVATSEQRWARHYEHLEARRPELDKLDL